MSLKFKQVLAIATVLSLCPALLFAQTSNPGQATTTAKRSMRTGKREAMHMVPASVMLLSSLDAAKMQPGMHFKARLTGKVHLVNGPELPSGTIFEGTVASDDMNIAANRKIALRFTQADLKDGTKIPIKATIVGVFTPSNEAAYSYNDASYAPVPNTWNDGTLAVDQINVTSGVDLHSRIASRNSGVFATTKKDDVKLAQGSDLNLAVAEAPAVGANSAASNSGEGS